MREYISEEEFKIMSALCDSGKDIKEIHKQFPKWSYNGIYHKLKQHGHIVKEPFKNRRKYFVNEDFFNNLEDERVLYFLGLLWTDGCINDKYNLVSLSLQEKDKNILEYFRNIIQPGKPLYYKKEPHSEQNGNLMIINSKKFVNYLTSIGCGPRKTLYLDWPKIDIREDLIHHFIRGLIDGDGCVYININNPKRCSISLVGCPILLKKVSELLSKTLDIHCGTSKCSQSDKVVNIRVDGRNQCKKLGEYLYKDATIYLKRKYDKYLLIKG